MITAILKTSFSGIRKFMLFNHYWGVLFNKVVKFPVYIHICRSHMTRALKDAVKRYYKEKAPDVNTVLSTLLRCFLESTSFPQCAFYAGRLMILCGTEFDGSLVDPILASYRDRMPLDFETSTATHKSNQSRFPSYLTCLKCLKCNDFMDSIIDNEHSWQNHDVSQCDGTTLHQHSAFGNYFWSIWDKVLKYEEDEKGPKNVYFNRSFMADYLLKSVFPYTPLVTHILFGIYEDVIEDDTATQVELHHRQVKHDEHGSMGPQRISRFCFSSKEMMLGNRCFL